jgi:hypothetical protein
MVSTTARDFFDHSVDGNCVWVNASSFVFANPCVSFILC